MRAGPRVLLTSEAAEIERTVRLAEATALVRDLVDTPAADLGPAELEAVRARSSQTVRRQGRGDRRRRARPGLSDDCRGRPGSDAGARAAADRALLGQAKALRASPIIGKGVCFDSGGLDIKPASGMRLMKKDMGGAAHALALAELIMAERLPVRLHLLIPAVENSVSAQPSARATSSAVAQGPEGRDRQYRRRRAAGARRRAGPGGRRQARADHRLRHADRRGAGRARPRSAGAVRQ